MTDISKETLRMAEEDKRELTKRIRVEFCSFNGKYVAYEAIKELIQTFLYFKPCYMKFERVYEGKFERYNEQEFQKRLRNYTEYIEKDKMCITLRAKKWGDEICIYITAEAGVRFFLDIPLESFLPQKENMLKSFGRLFYALDGAFAYFGNSFDARVMAHLTKESSQWYQLSEEELCGIDLSKDTTHLFEPDVSWSSNYDESYLPSEQVLYEGKRFMSAPYMWCGADMNRLTDEKKLKEFSDCEYNREIYPGVREICLWENINEYCHPEFRRRQWAFKNSIIEDVRSMEGKEYPFEDKRGDVQKYNDLQMEMHTTPEYLKHGGDIHIRMYFDKKKKPIGKSFAKYCVIREMKGNNIVFEEIKEL
jgi:hypothetical protein